MSEHGKIDGVQKTSLDAQKLQMQKQAALKRAEELDVLQTNSVEELEDSCNLDRFNPLQFFRKFKTLEERNKGQAEQKAATEASKTKEVEKLDLQKTAQKYVESYPELKEARLLLNLREMLFAMLRENRPLSDLLNMLDKSYVDPFLKDAALSFVRDTFHPNSKEGLNLQRCQEMVREKDGQAIRAGYNTHKEVLSFSKQALGSPTGLRDLYQDVTSNPRKTIDLFEELNELFSFEKLKLAIDFILHALGADLKSKGSSISRGELHRLMTEGKNMQAILGIFKFFQGRMKLIQSQCNEEEIDLPEIITFEFLAKVFIKMLQERYPSPEKILRLANKLGISEDLIAQVIIFTQYRDAIRGVSPHFFQSTKQKQDLLMTLIEVIGELDDLLDEETEEEEEETNPKGWSDQDLIE